MRKNQEKKELNSLELVYYFLIENNINAFIIDIDGLHKYIDIDDKIACDVSQNECWLTKYKKCRRPRSARPSTRSKAEKKTAEKTATKKKIYDLNDPNSLTKIVKAIKNFLKT